MMTIESPGKLKKMQSNSLFRFKRGVIATALALAFMWSAPTQSSGLEDVLNDQFKAMSNFTQPGVYEGQRRGVLSGGSMVVRNPIVNTQVVSMTPLGWKAGCGGIDLFAGSFSFINGEQFIQLLRSIASNAAGYAFQVALKTVCEDCLDSINSLQNKMQALNEFAGNSCQLAQGIVNTAGESLGFFEQKNMTDVRLYNGQNGLVDDFLSAWTQSDGKTNEQLLQDKKPDDYKDIVTGNLVWRQIKRNDISRDFFAIGRSDDSFLEEVMSLTGTIVHEEGKNNDKEGTPKKTYPAILTLEKMVIGGANVDVYQCADNSEATGCLKLNIKKTSMTGLSERILRALIGNDGRSGIIGKYANHSANITFTQEEKNILSALPQSVGTSLRNLAIHSQDAATQAARFIATPVAIDMAYHAAKEITAVVLRSTHNAKSTVTIEEVEPMLRRNRESLEAEYAQLRSVYGDINSSLTFMNNINRNVRKADIWVQERRNYGNSNVSGE